jgi:hypothetical protein
MLRVRSRNPDVQFVATHWSPHTETRGVEGTHGPSWDLCGICAFSVSLWHYFMQFPHTCCAGRWIAGRGLRGTPLAACNAPRMPYRYKHASHAHGRYHRATVSGGRAERCQTMCRLGPGLSGALRGLIMIGLIMIGRGRRDTMVAQHPYPPAEDRVACSASHPPPACRAWSLRTSRNHCRGLGSISTSTVQQAIVPRLLLPRPVSIGLARIRQPTNLPALNH